MLRSISISFALLRYRANCCCHIRHRVFDRNDAFLEKTSIEELLNRFALLVGLESGVVYIRLVPVDDALGVGIFEDVKAQGSRFVS
jgi:hypothetical protein